MSRNIGTHHHSPLPFDLGMQAHARNSIVGITPNIDKSSMENSSEPSTSEEKH